MRRLFPVKLALLCAAAAVSVVSSPAGADSPVDIVQALTCKLTARTYAGFALNLGDDETGYKSMGWIKEKSGTPFLSQYHLPAPIEVAGYRTSTLVFSASGIFAVLDIADPAKVAAPLDVPNTLMTREAAAAALGLTATQAAQLPLVTGFKGRRVVSDTVDDDAESHLKFHTLIVQLVENSAAYPGKTLLGCSYSIEVVEN